MTFHMEGLIAVFFKFIILILENKREISIFYTYIKKHTVTTDSFFQ